MKIQFQEEGGDRVRDMKNLRRRTYSIGNPALEKHSQILQRKAYDPFHSDAR